MGEADYHWKMIARLKRLRPGVIILGVVALFITFVALSAAFDWGGEDDGSGAVPFSEEATSFAMKVFADYGASDFEEVWSDLHPAQQRLVDKDQFVGCYEGQPGGYVEKIERDGDATQETVPVPGTRWRAKALIARVRITAQGGGDDAHPESRLVPVIRTAGRWAWILPRNYLKSFQRGRCPGWGPPPGAVV